MLLRNFIPRAVVIVIIGISPELAFHAHGQDAARRETESASDTTERSFADFLATISLDDASRELSDEEPSDEEDQTSNEKVDKEEVSQPAESSQLTESLLSLADVIASVYQSYPKILEARQEAARTTGEVTSAYGFFDTKVSLHSINEPTGFYENYRHGISAARQTWWGGYVSAGYRIGRDDFQPWYEERSTHEAGEVKISYGQALLQGRGIDPARVAIFQTSLDQQAAEPRVQQAILETTAEAAALYWQWVASGGILTAQRELLELAEQRGEQFAAGVDAGKFAEVDLILNRQLIAERRAKLLETQQKYQEFAFKLSVFLRNEVGQPLIPSEEWLPERFPSVGEVDEVEFDQELAAAMARRPEPRLLQITREKLQWDLELARNQTLPKVDTVFEASQDFGAPATSTDDKGEFVLVLGFRSEVPVQRRKARGKIHSTTAKLAQLDQKIRLLGDKLGAELRASLNRLKLAKQIVEQSEISLEAALESLDRYQFAFEKGKINLISLNLLEMKANETKIKLVEARRDWFVSLANLQTTLGLDPLEQAFLISELP